MVEKDPRPRDEDRVPPGTSAESARPTSPTGKPPSHERRDSSSESRGGLGRKARADLDDHPRRREDHSASGHHGDSDRGRRRKRSSREHREGKETEPARCEDKDSQPKSAMRPPEPPMDKQGTTYCEHCKTKVGGASRV